MQDYEVLTTSRFYLELTLEDSKDLIDGYFMDCSGFKRSHEVIEICEVTPPPSSGSNTQVVGGVVRTKIAGNTKCENITLRFGMTISDTMWKWFADVATKEKGNWAKRRKDGTLTLYNQGGEQQAQFTFKRAWPVSYKISDPKADSTDFQIEEVELAVEDFFRVTK